MNSWRRETLRTTVNFWGQSFSQGPSPPRYQQAGKGFIYFKNLPIIISQDERTRLIPTYFVDFFVFLSTELSTSFLFIHHWLLQKVFFGFPWPIKSSTWTFIFFPSIKIKSDHRYQMGQWIWSDNHRTILYWSHDHFSIQWGPAEIIQWVINSYIKGAFIKTCWGEEGLM